MIDFRSMSTESLARWSRTLVAKAREYSETLSLRDVDIQNAEDDATAIGRLAEAEHNAVQSDDPATHDQFVEYKNILLNGPSERLRREFPRAYAVLVRATEVGILTRLIRFVSRVMDSPAMTTEMADSMGLSAAKIDMLKRGEGDKAGWVNNFVEKIKGSKSTLGLSEAEVAAVSEDQRTMQQIEERTVREKVRAPDNPHLPELLIYKDVILQGPSQALIRALPGLAPTMLSVAPGILPRMHDFIRRITHSPHYDEAIGREMGIEEPVDEYVEPAGVAAPEPEIRGVREHRPTAPGSPPWLLPLVLVGLMVPLAYALWPRQRLTSPSPAGAGPLTIRDVTVIPAPAQATIAWETNRPTSGQVAYGKTSNLETSSTPRTITGVPETLVRSHSVKLIGLERSTQYFYRVTSTDREGVTVSTTTSSFQTP